MSLLPWLLDWPPTRGQIALFLLMTALSLGTIAVLGDDVAETDEPVTVAMDDPSVALNDEIEYPDAANGSIQTCRSSGIPGDHVAVRGDVTVDVPVGEGWWRTGERQPTVSVSLAYTNETTNDTVTGPGTETLDVFWLLQDDETLSVDDTATVEVDVVEDGSTVANTTESVAVEEAERNYDC